MSSISILVIGRTGQVAHELRRRSKWPADFGVDFVERPAIDLGRPDEARNAVIEARPVIVVNAAAYTAVDAAQKNVDEAFAINRDGPAALAEGCHEIGAPLIHYSTDYGFDGTRRMAPMSRTSRSTRFRSMARARRPAMRRSGRGSTGT